VQNVKDTFRPQVINLSKGKNSYLGRRTSERKKNPFQNNGKFEK